MRRSVMQDVQIIIKEQQAENRRLDDCRAMCGIQGPAMLTEGADLR
jgi:hypothetical protein